MTLTVARVSNHGLYLAEEEPVGNAGTGADEGEGGENEAEEVLLPNRYVSLEDKVGDRIEVFIYHDSENRLIATRERPLAVAGEAAFLEVVDKNVHGAFLAWGVTAKDLFVPNSNQGLRMEPGRKYVVFVYRDNVSGRVVATTKLNSFVSNENITVRPGQEIRMLVAQRVGAGFRVVIDNRHWGMIYDNQLFSKVHVGDRLTGYVRKVTEDNRIDVSLQQQGFDQVKVSAERLCDLLRENGGSLPLSDDSPPEDVARLTGMSKKVFKRSVGYLMSAGRLSKGDGEIKLIK